MANPPIAYPDYPAGQGGYTYLNYPLATDRAGITDGFGHTIVDLNRWQRLLIVNAVDQNGFPQGPIQNYLGAQWLGVRPFALARDNAALPWVDLGGPPPLLGTASHAIFRSNVVEGIRRSSELTPDDGVTMDISPGALGHNSLGANDGTGHTNHPATGLPYPPNVAKRGDFVRVLAEFWADGPSSETPPGHWNVLANGVADNTNKRAIGAPSTVSASWYSNPETGRGGARRSGSARGRFLRRVEFRFLTSATTVWRISESALALPVSHFVGCFNFRVTLTYGASP